jgi:hypothetical protein
LPADSPLHTHPSPAPQAKDTPGWFGDGWALLTRQERPKTKTLSNRQANRAARREAEKLARAQEGADGVTLVTVTPGAAAYETMDSTVPAMINPVSGTKSADTHNDNVSMTPSSSRSSPSSSTTPRVSGSGAESVSKINPLAATNRYVTKKVSFKDVVVLGSPRWTAPAATCWGAPGTG